MSEKELKNYDSDEDEAEFRIKDNYDDENIEFTNYFFIVRLRLKIITTKLKRVAWKRKTSSVRRENVNTFLTE